MRSTRDLLETLVLTVALLALYTSIVLALATGVWGIAHASDNTPWLRSYWNSVAVAVGLFASLVVASILPDASRALRLNFRKQLMKDLK